MDLDPETVYVADFAAERIEVNAAFRNRGADRGSRILIFGQVLMDVLVYRADAYGPKMTPPRHPRLRLQRELRGGQGGTWICKVLFEPTVDEARNVSAPAIVGARPPTPSRIAWRIRSDGCPDRGSSQAAQP